MKLSTFEEEVGLLGSGDQVHFIRTDEPGASGIYRWRMENDGSKHLEVMCGIGDGQPVWIGIALNSVAPDEHIQLINDVFVVVIPMATGTVRTST